ncbi:MAG: CehA/McbA family metallohydrolase [Planctomycetes bacterium]|nr:CehA/McbA family metallohydrolase [Planctomycetota bacterium]
MHPRRVVQLFLLAGISIFTSLAPCFPHEGHDPPLLGGIFPQISPDGESVVFSHQGAIWHVPREGGVMQRLTEEKGFDVRPTWSPDGTLVAYIRGRTAFAGPVRIMDISDRTLRNPPKPIGTKDKLAFSSDGKQLLGLFHREGKGYSLCWLDIESGELGDELHKDVRGLRYALSADGRSIALATTHDINQEQGGNNGPQCDLWTMPTSGGEPKKVLEFPGRVYDVAWNADGKSLIVVSNVGGVHNDLWQVPIADPVQGTRKLTFGQADEDAPSSDREGRWLVYTDNHRGPTSLVVRDLKSGRDSVVTFSARDYQQPTGKLLLSIRDSDAEPFVTARVTLQKLGGKYHAPSESLYRMLGEHMHFYCDDECLIEVPAGHYVITVARGPEYPVVHRNLSITTKWDTETTIELERWTNQREKGWYSGESHIHANYGYGEWYNSPRTMLAQSAGEDLIVSNFMVANSEADGVFDREYFRGAADPLSTDANILYWNQEFRSTIWGHLTLLNLKQLVEPIFTGFARTTHPHDHPTNADIADHTHDQDGHVNYTHPAHNVQDPYLSAYAAKALPLDVALGKVDSIDVMGSNHLATIPLWYRLLNCGFKVPASAGTDCFLNRVRSRLPGQARAYVKVEGDFSYEKWIAALKKGRTFVTNGPMFEFTINDHQPGDVITLEEPGLVQVKVAIKSQYLLNQFDVIYNGETVIGGAFPAGFNGRESTRFISIPRSGWIAMRAGGPSHPDQPGGSVFGHTSAVYVEVAGKPIDAKTDAEYFVNWIDRLRTDIRRRNRIPSRHQVHVESQIAEAREVFNNLLEQSE